MLKWCLEDDIDYILYVALSLWLQAKLVFVHACHVWLPWLLHFFGEYRCKWNLSILCSSYQVKCYLIIAIVSLFSQIPIGKPCTIFLVFVFGGMPYFLGFVHYSANECFLCPYKSSSFFCLSVFVNLSLCLWIMYMAYHFNKLRI